MGENNTPTALKGCGIKMVNFMTSHARELILDFDFQDSQDSSDEFMPTISDMDISTSESLPELTKPV